MEAHSFQSTAYFFLPTTRKTGSMKQLLLIKEQSDISVAGLLWNVIVNKKFPKMAEKIPHFIYLGKGTAIDAFPSFYLSF